MAKNPLKDIGKTNIKYQDYLIKMNDHNFYLKGTLETKYLRH